jgi:hypothetical protein
MILLSKSHKKFTKVVMQWKAMVVSKLFAQNAFKQGQKDSIPLFKPL